MSLSTIFHFKKAYCLAAALVLTLEIIIAVTVHDAIIRPYGGDFLAPIFVCCLSKSFLSTSTKLAIAGTLLLCYLVEGLQYLPLLDHLGLKNSHLARIVLGSCFAWRDMLAYTLGALAVWAAMPGAKAWQAAETLPAA